MKKIGIVLLVLIFIFAEAVIAQDAIPESLNLQTPQKKLIATGQGLSGLRIVDFKQMVEDMENTPFDGLEVGYNVTSPDGFLCKASSMFANKKWEKEWFENDVEILKKVKPVRVKHNFFKIYLNSATKDGLVTRLSWKDDAHWANAINNVAVIAWVAKQSGCFTGLIMDSEDYGRKQFTWQPSDGSYQETSRLARLRGAQMMKAIVNEYPDATLLFYWFLSLSHRIANSPTPSIAVEQNGNLWVPFANGMLDTIAPTIKIVDGNEHGYKYMGTDFARSAESTRNVLKNLVAEENKAKYSGQVQVGFGLYMNAHVNPETSKWYMPPLNGSQTARLADNIKNALKVSDEYVWVYGERRQWSRVGTPAGKIVSLWQDVLPGVTKALWFVKAPATAAKMKMESNTKVINICPNSGFEAPNEGENKWNSTELPALWSNSPETLTKNFTLDNTFGFRSSRSAKAKGVTDGCFLLSVNVNPGETYAIEGKAFHKGNSRGHILVRWKTADNKWVQELNDVYIYYTEQIEGWKKAFGAATVPEGVNQLAVLLIVKQPQPTDECWFDDIGIYRVN